MAYVAYYRVSTRIQSLSLEAQQDKVKAFVGENTLLAEYSERGSGKKANRTELEKAMIHAKETNSTLVVAKLDRLSRDVEFIFSLKRLGVDFICLDMPDLNTLTLGIFATFAQHEREMISERTKAGLAKSKKQQARQEKAKQKRAMKATERLQKLQAKQQAKLEKAKGESSKTESMRGKTASKESKQLAQKAGIEARLNNSYEHNLKLYKIIKRLLSDGKNLLQIANFLNDTAQLTFNGKTFQAETVKRLIKRFS